MRGLYIAVAAATAVNAALVTSYLHSDQKKDDGDPTFYWGTAVKGAALAVAGDVVGIAPILVANAVSNALR